MGAERLKVLYIAGSGRCGSTLLTTLLGQQPGYIDLGEIRYIWERGYEQNRKCGCGADFLDCAYWRGVEERAFGHLSPEEFHRMADVTRQATRYRNIGNLKSTEWRARHGLDDDYLEKIYKLYYAASSGGKSIIVDSSKIPTYARILALLEDIEVYFLHLVRDPRAVVYSWGKKVAYEPGSGRDMDQFGAFKSAMMWKMANHTARGLQELGPYMQIRYEDLAADPDTAVAEIVGSVSSWAGIGGEAVPMEKMNFEEQGHSVAGNPMRFNLKNLKIKRDDAWVKSMAWPKKLGVRMLCFSELARYGYDKT